MNPTASLTGTPTTGLEQALTADIEALTNQLGNLENEIGPHTEAVPNDAHHLRTQALWDASQAACRCFEEACDDPDSLHSAQQRFRLATEPWFRHSWIANRARTKPSGFPGDYDMLLKLYAMETPARGLGAYLDLCIQDLPLARAVRARLAAARQFLLQEIEARATDVRILDIASGPCQEYLNWPDAAGGRQVEIVAMDSDPQALEYVATNVCPQLGPNTKLQPERYNALRTRSANATVRKFGKFDIIYSVGLCDYLPDEHLIGLLAAWRETLNEGGALYVAFKDTNFYDKTPYQWHLDWHFFQRTPADVMFLYEQAGFDVAGLETTRDETGIIVNFLARPDAQPQRADAAHKLPQPHHLRLSTEKSRRA